MKTMRKTKKLPSYRKIWLTTYCFAAFLLIDRDDYIIFSETSTQQMDRFFSLEFFYTHVTINTVCTRIVDKVLARKIVSKEI